MPKVFFQKEFREVEVPAGANLRKVALEQGISVDREQFFGVNCGGIGICGTCKIWVREREPNATNRRGWRERALFFRFFDGWRRLACLVEVRGDIDVWTSPGEKDRIGTVRTIEKPPSPVAEARARGQIASADDEKKAAAAAGAAESSDADAGNETPAEDGA